MNRRLQETLGAIFNIRHREFRIVSQLLSFSFFQGLGQAFLFSAAYVLFVSNVEISNLPLVFIYTAMVLLFADAIIDRLERIVSVGKLIENILYAVVIAILIFGVLLGIDETSYNLLFGLLVLEKVVALTINSEFGKMNTLLFDVRQSKRLFGLLSSPEVPSRILGLMAVPFLIRFVSINEILFCSAVCFGIAIFFFYRIRSLNHLKFRQILVGSKSLSKGNKEGSNLYGIGSFKISPYVVSLCAFMFLLVGIIVFVEVLFLSEVDQNYDDQKQLAYFFGTFFSIEPFFTFFFKSYASGRLIAKKGIGLTLSILPYGLIVLCSLALLFIFFNPVMDLWVFGFMMLFSAIIRSSFTEPAFFTLFQTWKDRERYRSFKIVAIVESASYAVAGLIILAIFWLGDNGFVDNDVALISTLLFTTVGVAVVILFLKKGYANHLEKAITRRSLNSNVNLFEDKRSMLIIEDHLQGTNAKEVLYTIDLLKKKEINVLREHSAALLHHDDDQIVIEILSIIESNNWPELKEEILILLDNASGKVRAKALSTLCMISGPDIFDLLAPYLSDKNGLLVKSAMIGLLRNGGISGVMNVGELLLKMTRSPNSEEKIAAAEIIGEVGLANFYQPLIALIKDESVDVRKAALYAASKVKNEFLLPFLIQELSSLKISATARSAIISYGDAALPSLMREFNSVDTPMAIKRKIVYVIGRIGGQQSRDVLFANILIEEYTLREQIYFSLVDSGFESTEQEKEIILDIVDDELERAAYFLQISSQLNGSQEFLPPALQREISQVINKVVTLFALIYNRSSMLKIRYILSTESLEKDAVALELLELLINEDLKSKIFPLIEDLPLTHKIQLLKSHYTFSSKSLNENLKLISDVDYQFVHHWTKTVIRVSLKNNVNSNIQDAVLTSELKPTGMKSENSEFELLLIEKVLLLKSVKMFSETPNEILSEVAFALEDASFKSGQTILNEGEEGECMYIIFEGKVKIHKGNTDLAELGEKEVFGELSLLDPEPRSASVSAITDVNLVKLDRYTFYEIMTDRPEVIRGILKVLSKRLRNQNEIISKLKNSTSENEELIPDN